MEILLLAFSNSREHPLETLADEYAALNKTLSPRALRQHFLSWAISHATLDDIAYYLTLFRDRLSLFLFSGHAGRDALFTETGESRAAGIAHLLGQCQGLKVVVLNGCSTAGQVEALHNAGVPLVIATSAPVQDELAARFSARFFQALEAGLTVGDAFEQAIGETLAIRPVQVFRKLAKRDEQPPDTPVWGLFPNPDKPDAAGWKLPQHSAHAVHPRFEPNELLVETLYETLAATNPAVKALHDAQADLEERRSDIVYELQKALPAPISEQVRKLLAPSPPGSNQGWDKVGEMRLQQLALTYQICMEFLVFTFLAQLWETAFRETENPQLPEALKAELDAFLDQQAAERSRTDYFSLLRNLQNAFQGGNRVFFIPEYEELNAAFLENDEVKNACFFLETLRRRAETATPAEMPERCERAEKALSDLFARLGFLGRYTLATVRNINVHKYRHLFQTHFEHLIMKWHGAQGHYDKEYRRQTELMDNRSVVLLRTGEEDPGNTRFLSLAPFILDENTFEEVPDTSVSKLYFFARRENGRLLYKSVNFPETDIIDLDDPVFYERRKKTGKFQLAKEQFDAFYQTVVHPQTPDRP